MAEQWWISRHFNRVSTGSTALIAMLHERLEQEHIVALSGLGGMGKSEVAMEYIRAYGEHRYDTVIWLDTSSSIRMNADFFSMSKVSPELFNKLWIDNERTLLILDNLQDINIVKSIIPLPRWRGHMLLTTRRQQTTFPSLLLPLLSLEESALFVLRRGRIISEQGSIHEASETDREAAYEIAREMDGFPLALEQAGTYLEEVGCTPSSYLSTIRNRG